MAITFTNCRLCLHGSLFPNSAISFSTSTGLITSASVNDTAESEEPSHEIIDLKNHILAPGFLELQTNGLRGFHFTHFDANGGAEGYARKLDEVARYLPSTGVTAFWATVPTVSKEDFQKILPCLASREIEGGATLLGAHAEGPYLHPNKKGAHNASLFHLPSETSSAEIYGTLANDNSTLKVITIAPELVGSNDLISELVSKDIRVSLGHSSASYDAGLEALKSGATCLTHTLNAMAPLHHRDPGLAGLVTAPAAQGVEAPYFSIIPDGNHLHHSVCTMLFRSNPSKCILITDSIELAGLPDGTYPGHSQIPFSQTKVGSKVVIEGTDTMVGGCASLDECVRNLMRWSGCSVAEALRCVTENIVTFMGDHDRGVLEVERRADFVVLDDEANVISTWIRGGKVWERQ